MPVQPGFFNHQVMSFSVKNTFLCHDQHNDIDHYPRKTWKHEAGNTIKIPSKATGSRSEIVLVLREQLIPSFCRSSCGIEVPMDLLMLWPHCSNLPSQGRYVRQ